ncbi:MAG: hypothetical protein JNJ71_12490 [Rubrivivax sp.]|nr:hypothetical protein [Rubrivivax sp.]
MLAACGGGGDASAPAGPVAAGGATASTPGTAAEAPRSSKSGFIPAAPQAGETLHADAALLRPLRDEALWVYRGIKSSSSGKAAYSTFRQTITAAGAFEERFSSPLDNASSVQGIQISGGAVQVRDNLGLPAGAAPASIVELRSPVRKDDQITLADLTGITLGEDLDQDKKADLIDLGVYSRVIGNENVELPELGRTVLALRVDVTATARIQLSSRTQPEPAVTVLESTWYAPGIGIVRQTSSTPASGSNGAVETDERLQYWDGVATGAGLVPSAPVSRSGGASSIGPWLELPFAAVRNGAQAFVLSSRGGLPVRPDRGVVLSVLDQRGRVLHNVDHQDLDLAATAQPEIMALGDGVAMTFTEPGVYADPYMLENLRMVRFDAQGQRSGSHWLASGALPGTLKAASDGQTVWVTWVEPGFTAGATRVMVQGFDARGVERSLPQLLETRNGFEPATIGISAAANRALVTWRAPHGTGVDYRQAVIQPGVAPAVATLETGALTLDRQSAQPVPRLSESLAALTWYNPLRQATGGSTATTLPRGVVLDASSNARRAVAGAADNETLPLPAHEPQAAAMNVEASRLLWSAAGAARVRSEDLVDDRYLDFAALRPETGALSAAAVQMKRYRDRSPASGYFGNVAAVRQILAFDDRYLIVGHDGTRLTLAVLHKD